MLAEVAPDWEDLQMGPAKLLKGEDPKQPACADWPRKGAKVAPFNIRQDDGMLLVLTKKQKMGRLGL